MNVEAVVRRIGLYGGAFDPPHLAHLAMADAFVAQCQLDELRVLPTGQAWHKAHTTSPAHHRWTMTQLAFAGRPGVVVDDREIQRAGPTYTADTLRQLQAEVQAQATPTAWFLLIGQDQWARFATWHRWREIAQNATIVVASRANLTSGIGQKDSESLFLPLDADGSGQAHCLAPQRLNWQPLAFSSTQIRAALRMLSSPSADPLVCVPPQVARYISQQQLYCV